MHRRTRTTRGGLLAALAALATAAIVTGGGAAAQAVETDAWGGYTVTGAGGAYSGTLSLPGGFPATAFTTNTSQATVPSGASTWQAASTPVGGVYGSSRDLPYLNQRPAANNAASPSITTYSFATPTPASGWSFALGDIDADQVTLSATDPAGNPVPVAELGYQGSYNYCHRAGGPSCDSAGLNDQPTWSDNGDTGLLLGNAGAADTEGAAAWFSPSTALGSLTMSFQWRSGFPIYQTWFAEQSFGGSGLATLDGQPAADVAVTVYDANDVPVATATTGPDGSWSVPSLVSADGYRAEATPPAGASAAPPVPFSLGSADASGVDFAFLTTVSVSGTVSTPEGPAAEAPVSVLPTGGADPVGETTTDAAGVYTVPELLPETDYVLVIDAPDGFVDQAVPFRTGTADLELPAIALAPTAPPTTPATPVTPAQPAPALPAAAPRSPAQLAATGSASAIPGLLVAALLLATGVLVSRRRSTGP